MSNETRKNKSDSIKSKKDKRLKLNIRDHLNENDRIESLKSISYYSMKSNNDPLHKEINDSTRSDQFLRMNIDTISKVTNDPTSTNNRVRLFSIYYLKFA